jgi:hypothetical protein
MPTDLELLLAARSAALTALATGAGRPDYTIDGQSVSYSSLVDRLARLNTAIAALEGPIELDTEGTT